VAAVAATDGAEGVGLFGELVTSAMLKSYFSAFAQKASEIFGSVWAFVTTVVLIALWTVGGFFLGFTDTYQLIINTVSTLTTSIFVVLIQHTQMRQEAAMNKKLDELIRAIDKADNRLIAIEKQPPERDPPTSV
jgi:low affinity Fe/Cu permease